MHMLTQSNTVSARYKYNIVSNMSKRYNMSSETLLSYHIVSYRMVEYFRCRFSSNKNVVYN